MLKNTDLATIKFTLPIISKIVNSLGFPITSTPLFEIASNVSVSEADLQKKNQVFYNWEISISLSDEKDRVVFSSYEKGRDGGLNQTSALDKVYNQIEKRLNNTIERELEEYLFSFYSKK